MRAAPNGRAVECAFRLRTGNLQVRHLVPNVELRGIHCGPIRSELSDHPNAVLGVEAHILNRQCQTTNAALAPHICFPIERAPPPTHDTKMTGTKAEPAVFFGETLETVFAV
jgi:hypothetical protein